MTKNGSNLKMDLSAAAKAQTRVCLLLCFLLLFSGVMPGNVYAEQEWVVGQPVQTIANPAGTTINLFNYTVYNPGTNESVTTIPNGWNPSTGYGINEGHSLVFRENHWTPQQTGVNNGNWLPSAGGEWWNHWTGDSGGSGNDGWGLPNQGIVQRTLQNGYPVLSSNIPNSESLNYLFDLDPITGSNNLPAKEVYTGLSDLFYTTDDGYYTFDSNWERAKVNCDTGDPTNCSFDVTVGQLPEYAHDDAHQDDRPQFKPFVPADGEDRTNPEAFFLGMHMQVESFSIPENGLVENPSHEMVPMTFEFSGDDDVWIFIDGVLVGDIGGIHLENDLKINFQTGEVTIENKDYPAAGNYNTTIRQAFRDAGKEDTTSWNGNTFADFTYHTLDFFYLERGASLSNLEIKYNLVSTYDFGAHKTLHRSDGDPVLAENQFRFKLTGYADENDGRPAVMPPTQPDPDVIWIPDYGSEPQTLIAGNSSDGNVNFGHGGVEYSDYENNRFKYVIEELPPEGATLNADGSYTYQGKIVRPNDDGTFTFGDTVYKLDKYYFIGYIVQGNYLKREYYTDETYTTRAEDITYIDFDNYYGASGHFRIEGTKKVNDADNDL